MPAVRTGKGRRDGEDSFQVTWSPSALPDPAEPQKFSFAPNVTPVTFTAPPPADEDDVPSQSTLFPDPAPSSDRSTPPSADSPVYTPAPKRRRKTAGPKDAAELGEDGSVAPEHIPRPPNAFILFRSSFIKSQHVSSSIEGNHGTLSKIVGMVWHNLSFEERQIWQAKAKRALAEHKRRFPEYSFRPSNKDKDRLKLVSADDARSSSSRDGSAPPPKRKQRECGPRDEARCEHIASLVAKGLKGRGLEEAVKLFDTTRAPAVITPRFEQPITAKQFEGSSTKVKVEPKEEKINDQQQQQQQLSKQPLQRFRRGSSAPLLDSDYAETSRRQSFFMQRSASPLQPCPIRPAVNMMPSIRSQRKRSASSSPPVRPRALLPAACLPSMPTFMSNQAPHLTLSTSMSSAEMANYASSAPMSAPALSRQPTLLMDQHPPSDYYEYDNGQGVWYDGASGSSPNTATGSEYSFHSSQSWENPSFDFSSFSFSGANSSTPAPVISSQTDSYSPFDNSAASAVEDYSGMPMLVEPPPHPHSLQIQTNWAQSEFDYDHSQAHAYYPPPSASTLDSASASSPVKPYAQPGMSYSMSDLGVYTSPTSPSNTSVSDYAATQAHTPREGSAEPRNVVYTPAPKVYGAPQHESASCYTSTQLAYDGGMGSVNVSVSVDVDPRLLQAFFPQPDKLGNYAYHPSHFMGEIEQPQPQLAL